MNDGSNISVTNLLLALILLALIIATLKGWGWA